MKIMSILMSLGLMAPLALAKADAPTFHQLSAKELSGKPVDFKSFDGKVVLVVNTASRCGYTPQYGGLQKLYESYKGRGLVVVGFPSDDFRQEDLNGKDIAKFCSLNYGVTFPMFEKIHVNGAERHPVYQYLLTHAPKAGDVQWNFEKFLVDRRGQVVGRYSSQVTPSDGELTKAIDQALAAKAH
ncbi:MAG: glutathione peroxidase [Proteobacteria bacterium]|nr:glutathione peroxidase [Pseudomonadota bacterium]